MALAMTEGYHYEPHPPQGILNNRMLFVKLQLSEKLHLSATRSATAAAAAK
jgi:hypothetical protein